MIFWLLYVTINKPVQYPYHFAMKDNCSIIGKDMVKRYKFKSFECKKVVK